MLYEQIFFEDNNPYGPEPDEQASHKLLEESNQDSPLLRRLENRVNKFCLIEPMLDS
jgi:hypothetical protein